jgi:hypothetical protein
MRIGLFLRLLVTAAMVVCVASLLGIVPAGRHQPASCRAASVPGIETLHPGLVLFEKGKYLKAAEAWLENSEEAEKDRNLKTASLANVLASMAFEKVQDVRAYLCFSTALRYFLEAGTTWDVERRALKYRIEEIASRLAKSPGWVRPAEGSDPDLVLTGLEEALSFTSYQGPKPGLKIRAKTDKDPYITVTRNYFPRPLVITREEEGDEASGKIGTARTPLRALISDQDAVSVSDPGGSVDKGAGAAAVTSIRGRFIVPVVDIAPGVKPASAPPEAGPRGQVLQAGAGLPPALLPTRRAGAASTRLSDQDMAAARSAWQYFISNFQQNTGLVNSVHNYPYATLWDMASGLAAVVAAEQIGIIAPREFKEKIILMLESMLGMELYNKELPNRQYNTATGMMVDLKNRPTHTGTGWAALDVGRMLIWLRITWNWYPDLRDLVEKILDRWEFHRACRYSELNGVLLYNGKELLQQEGRFGYEQYAAAGYHLWGEDVAGAMDWDSVEKTELLDVRLHVDRREKSFLTSEPFMLSMLELGGIDREFSSSARAVYQVQKRRWEKTEVLTAVSEDSVNRRPWFVYNCIMYDGMPWACMASSGTPEPGLKSLSTKAAFAWSAIFPDEYSSLLRQEIEKLRAPRYGYYAGRFETGEINNSRNINTNAVILETLLFIRRGGKTFVDLKMPPGPESGDQAQRKNRRSEEIWSATRSGNAQIRLRP